jgi:hypothetical protein
MPELEIKDRDLVLVHFMGLDSFVMPNGSHAVGGTCQLGLQAYDGSLNGPRANIFFSVPAPRQLTLQEAQRAVLTRAHEILCRLASFSVADLERAFEQKRERDAKEGIPQMIHNND